MLLWRGEVGDSGGEMWVWELGARGEEREMWLSAVSDGGETCELEAVDGGCLSGGESGLGRSWSGSVWSSRCGVWESGALGQVRCVEYKAARAIGVGGALRWFVGIIHETTVSYTPQQNGISERRNRVLKEMVNSMLSYSGLSQGFYADDEDQLSAKHQLVIKGLANGKASASNLIDIQVKDIVKEVEDYLKIYSSAQIDIRWYVEGIL
ncbi:zinc finger, CCHC-type containing protein [Tanacetum coccineum]|uniref:Zinc finger, CCHC-type containing protein n=1 Tax=Tanacetum coccineum TaxID=301880 RepID=A0ABQ5HS94_9ASTR